MRWRVVTRPGKGTLEIIDPVDWNKFTLEKQNAYQAVMEFTTEQEADKFGKTQVEAAKAKPQKVPRKKPL